jgi:hypothetical protein
VVTEPTEVGVPEITAVFVVVENVSPGGSVP